MRPSIVTLLTVVALFIQTEALPLVGNEDSLGQVDDVPMINAQSTRSLARSTKAPTNTKAPTTSKLPTNAPTKNPTKPPTAASSTTGDTAFSIDIYYASPLTTVQQEAFERARTKWMSVFSGDLASSVVLSAGTWCGFSMPTLTIDDILIAVRLKTIDGDYGILGQAGPCGMDNAGFPRFGIMEFDVDDVDMMISQGILDAVILHEMGHVLGIGTLWNQHALVDSATISPMIAYNGGNGNQGNAEIGRTGKAYIEDKYSDGTKGSHWKEDLPQGYDSELMTGFVEGAGVPMPMSRLTVRSLADLGYNVDINKADAFTAPAVGRRLRSDKKVTLGKDTIDIEPKIVPSTPKPGREKEYKRNVNRFHNIKHGKH